MTALSVIIDVVLILISIALIAAVLLQQGQRQGLGAISGGAETFLGKNKASSAEGKLKLFTKIAAAVFIVLAIVSTIITSHIASSASDATDTTDGTAVEATVDPEATADPEATVDPEASEEPAATDDADATEAPADDAAEATAEPDAEATEAPADEAEPTATAEA